MNALHRICRRRGFLVPVSRGLLACLGGGLAGCQPSLSRDEPASPETAALLMLEQQDLKVGLLPQVGGRIVLVEVGDGGNFLLSDPALWQPAAWTTPDAHSPWVAYNGHTTWLSPQSGWWTQQDQRPEKRGATWPPDPYLIYGDYTVTRPNPHTAILTSPPSPISGVQLSKTVVLHSSREIEVTVEALGQRARPVTWGLWSNTRFRGDTPFLVALAGEQAAQIRYGQPHALRGEVVGERWFHWPRATAVAAPRANKAFLATEVAWTAAFTPAGALVKTMAPVMPAAIHPEHAPVEVYLALAPDPAEALLELEFHVPAQTLAQGERIRLSERWLLFPDVPDHLDARLAWAEAQRARDEPAPQ